MVFYFTCFELDYCLSKHVIYITRVPPNINKNVLIFDTIKLNKRCSEGEAVMWLVKSRDGEGA